MAEQVRGVVATGEKQPVTVETIVVPDPGPGEVTVRVQACGVCHTDLHYREGGIGNDFPYLLGHEAAGVVDAIGDGVTSVAAGDFVILNWRAVCGECRACRRGRPWYCFSTHNAQQKMTLADGTPLSPALGIGAFAERTLVAAGQCTKVNPAIAPATAGLLGCGVMAGLGAAINTGGVGRGDSVAVIGCGGVGGAAIAGLTLVHWPAATSVRSANAPMPSAGDSGVPSARVIFCRALCVLKQYQGRPRLHARHWPQTARQLRITKSPGATSVTSSPTASTIPDASCPSR